MCVLTGLPTQKTITQCIFSNWQIMTPFDSREQRKQSLPHTDIFKYVFKHVSDVRIDSFNYHFVHKTLNIDLRFKKKNSNF